MYMPYDMKF